MAGILRNQPAAPTRISFCCSGEIQKRRNKTTIIWSGSKKTLLSIWDFHVFTNPRWEGNCKREYSLLVEVGKSRKNEQCFAVIRFASMKLISNKLVVPNRLSWRGIQKNLRRVKISFCVMTCLVVYDHKICFLFINSRWYNFFYN